MLEEEAARNLQSAAAVGAPHNGKGRHMIMPISYFYCRRVSSIHLPIPPRRYYSVIERDVYQYVTGPCKVKPGSRVFLCVSGGSDSMSMLHIMVNINKRYQQNPFKLEVIHYNHKLRAESDEEAKFVQNIVVGYGIPFHLREWRPSSPVTSGVQSEARKWRRLESLKLIGDKKEVNHSVVMTAHILEDRVETFFMKFLRGAHISKLNMMDPREKEFVKPLLNLSKHRLQEYLRHRDLEWREDPSNSTRNYQRNRVRLDLIPLLDKLAGGEQALYRRCISLSHQSKQLQGWLQKEIDDSDMLWYDSSRLFLIDVEKEKSFHNLSSLAKGELIFNFISSATGITLDYFTVHRLLELSQPIGIDAEVFSEIYFTSAPKGDTINKCITISAEWEVKRERNALVLLRRNK